MRRQRLHPAVAELDRERLSPEEFARLLAIPVSDEEVVANMALVRWFKRRYPSARERFAYARRHFDLLPKE